LEDASAVFAVPQAKDEVRGRAPANKAILGGQYKGGEGEGERERERKGMCTRKREEAEERRDGVSVLKREEAEGRKRMQCERGRRTLREREKLAAQAGIPGDNLSTLTT